MWMARCARPCRCVPRFFSTNAIVRWRHVAGLKWHAMPCTAASTSSAFDAVKRNARDSTRNEACSALSSAICAKLGGEDNPNRAAKTASLVVKATGFCACSYAYTATLIATQRRVRMADSCDSTGACSLTRLLPCCRTPRPEGCAEMRTSIASECNAGQMLQISQRHQPAPILRHSHCQVQVAQGEKRRGRC